MWRNFSAQIKLSRELKLSWYNPQSPWLCHFLIPMLVPWGEVACQEQARMPHGLSMYLWGVFILTDGTSLLLSPWLSVLAKPKAAAILPQKCVCQWLTCGISRGAMPPPTTPKLPLKGIHAAYSKEPQEVKISHPLQQLISLLTSLHSFPKVF